MGKGLHLAGMIAALLVAAPALAVGQASMSDGGTGAPKERRFDPYGKPAPKTHQSPGEDWGELRKRCKRNHEPACIRQLRPIETEPLRDDLKPVTR